MQELTQFKNCELLRAGQLVHEDLWVRAGRIVNPEEVFYVEKVKADKIVDCSNALIAPGFIDIQINGGWGIDFSYDIEDVASGVQKVSKQLLVHGVTSFCPTVVTSAPTTYRRVLSGMKRIPGGQHGATVLGVHLEGPFINVAKKGTHNEQFIRHPEKGMDSLHEVYGSLDNVSILTLAPELPGASDVIKGASSMGIKVAVGHSTATLGEGEEAVKNGANLITHLFNAMLPFHHRDPGLVGLLASPVAGHVHYGIISDGIHTHPAALRIAHRTNSHGLVLVSDALPSLGLPDGRYHLGSMTVDVHNGYAYRADSQSQTLSGGTRALDACVRTLMESTGCSTEYALEAASLHPARALGIENRKGTLNFGADADFVLLQRGSLKVLSTWIAGHCVFESS